jgi:hypothetical protein
MPALSKTSALLAAAASLVLLACGGAAGSLFENPAGGDDGGGGCGGVEAGASDASAPGVTPDAGSGDAGPQGSDAGTGAVSCAAPIVPDGGQYFGCAQIACPSGTVCVQRDFDVSWTAKCVGIPAACVGVPTCACMGAVAQECVEPGVPVTDAGGILGCQDDEEGDASFLDFPCGCA